MAANEHAVYMTSLGLTRSPVSMFRPSLGLYLARHTLRCIRRTRSTQLSTTPVAWDRTIFEHRPLLFPHVRLAIDLTMVPVGPDDNASHRPPGTTTSTRNPFLEPKLAAPSQFVPDLAKLTSPTTNTASWLRTAESFERRLAITVACC